MSLRISAWGIRNPIPVAILFVALTIAGLIAYAKLPIKRFPNIAFPVAAVSVTQAGAAPAQMETQITRPVEDAIAGVSNVKHISSNVSLGVSTTSIEFELGTDMQKSTDDIRTAVERVRVNLPPGIDPPVVQRIDIDSAPILTYAVSSPKMAPQELSWFVDDTVARALQAQPGVAQVGRVGGVDREINVTLVPARLRAFGVTAPQVNAALYQFNTDESGGRAGVGGQEQTVRVLGQAQTVAALRALVIPVPGRFVRLSDVAEVGDGAAEPRRFARLNGRPAVAFQVNKTKDSSEVTSEDGVKAAVAKLAAAHPEVRFDLIVSTVDETRHSFEATTHVLLEGMVLAALVVFLFLKNWRATLISAAAMPLSLIPTFIAMAAFGFSLNVVTLLGLTLVIGILVDDAIVEIENIEKRIERGQSPYRAALIGADSIGLAVIATTAAIVVVFLPVSFMAGITGQFFREFGLTVAVAVLFSLVVARLLTPLLAAYFLKPVTHARPPHSMPGYYRRALDWALGHPWLSAIFGGALFIGTIVFVMVGAATGFLPVGFQPIGNPGYLYLNVEGPPGASRAAMERASSQATRLLLAERDVKDVFVQIGSGGASGGFAPPSGGGLTSGTITVVLKEHRGHTTDGFKKLIRPKLRTIPDVRITTLGGFGSADVEMVLSSENGPLLQKTQLELWKQMRTLRQVSDARPQPAPPGPELVIRPKPEEAARLGVTSQSLAQVLRIATIGDIDAASAKFSEGERRIPIRVRLPEADRDDLQTLGDLQVPIAGGTATTPLSTVADLSFEAGPANIVRYGRERRASVQADLNGSSLGTALQAGEPAADHAPPAAGGEDRAAGGRGGAVADAVRLPDGDLFRRVPDLRRAGAAVPLVLQAGDHPGGAAAVDRRRGVRADGEPHRVRHAGVHRRADAAGHRGQELDPSGRVRHRGRAQRPDAAGGFAQRLPRARQAHRDDHGGDDRRHAAHRARHRRGIGVPPAHGRGGDRRAGQLHRAQPGAGAGDLPVRGRLGGLAHAPPRPLRHAQAPRRRRAHRRGGGDAGHPTPPGRRPAGAGRIGYCGAGCGGALRPAAWVMIESSVCAHQAASPEMRLAMSRTPGG